MNSESQDPNVSESAQTSTGSAPGEAEGSLESQLQQARSERDELQERWQRSVADFDNFCKRMQKEAEQERVYQVLGLARDLLPGIDNLYRTLQAAQTARDLDQLLQGLQMVTKQFDEGLARHQVVPIAAGGQPFDPNLHEAIQQMPSAEHPPMTVLAEVERGYKLRDRVVRPSKVIVSSAPAG
jgi:molecular chaperone GrpE